MNSKNRVTPAGMDTSAQTALYSNIREYSYLTSICRFANFEKSAGKQRNRSTVEKKGLINFSADVDVRLTGHSLACFLQDK